MCVIAQRPSYSTNNNISAIQLLQVENQPISHHANEFVVRLFPPRQGRHEQATYYEVMIGIVRSVANIGSFMAWRRKVQLIHFSVGTSDARQNRGFDISPVDFSVGGFTTAIRMAALHGPRIPMGITHIHLKLRFADSTVVPAFDRKFNEFGVDSFRSCVASRIPYAFPAGQPPAVSLQTYADKASRQLNVTTTLSWPTPFSAPSSRSATPTYRPWSPASL